MLEILLLWFGCKKIGDMVENKGYGSALFKILFVVAYFLGLLFGSVLGHALTELQGAPAQGTGMLRIYGFALVGALLGAGSVFFLALILPEQGRERDYMDDYYGSRRRRGSGERLRRRREEDDRPRRDDYEVRDRPRRRSADDDRPRRREDDRDRRRDDDEDRPRRRGDDRFRNRSDDEPPRKRRREDEDY